MGGFKCCVSNLLSTIPLLDREETPVVFRLRRVLPVANSVAQGRVPIAILSVDCSAMTQQVLHHVQMALAGGDVQRRAAIVVFETQVAAL